MLILAGDVGVALTAWVLMAIFWRVMNARLEAEATEFGGHAHATGFAAGIDGRHEPPRATDLRQLLDDLLRDRESLLRHSGIVLDQSAGHGGLYVNGRREELRQLLAHVLVMACRAMPRGGLLDVRATARDGQGVIEFLDARSGGQEPLLAALFRHGSDNPQGPGQVDEGLRACVASCQRIVDGHRGRIDAGSSGAAGGAGLTIRLPLAGRPVKVE